MKTPPSSAYAAIRTLGVASPLALLVAFFPGALHAGGQTPTESAATTTTTETSNDSGDTPEWSFAASVYAYFVPGDHDYLQPSVTADRGELHLEARYNYEAPETGSAWVGYNLSGTLSVGGTSDTSPALWNGFTSPETRSARPSGGGKLSWEFTPMLGAAFGETTGIAPGYRLTLAWWRLEFSSEGEYLVDPGDSAGNFFYNWSELSIAPTDWLRLGIATQRTRAYESEREIQRGLLAGVTIRHVDLTTYLFDLDQSQPTVVVALAFDF